MGCGSSSEVQTGPQDRRYDGDVDGPVKSRDDVTNRGTKRKGGGGQGNRSSKTDGRAKRLTDDSSSKYHTRSYTTEQQDGEELREQGYKRRIRNDILDATQGKDISALEKAIDKFERNRLIDCDDLSNAQDRLDFLKLKRDLRDAIKRNHVGVMERAIERARESGWRTALEPQIAATERKMLNQAELNRYAHDILAMEPQTISEIHSYHRPPACVHDVMAASYMLLGHDEAQLRDWSYIQGMAGRLGKSSLINQVKEFDTEAVDEHTARRVREIIDYHDLDEIRSASNGAATFHCWAESVTGKINRDAEEKRQNQEQGLDDELEDRYREEEKPPSMAAKQQIAKGRR